LLQVVHSRPVVANKADKGVKVVLVASVNSKEDNKVALQLDLEVQVGCSLARHLVLVLEVLAALLGHPSVHQAMEALVALEGSQVA